MDREKPNGLSGVSRERDAAGKGGRWREVEVSSGSVLSSVFSCSGTVAEVGCACPSFYRRLACRGHARATSYTSLAYDPSHVDFCCIGCLTRRALLPLIARDRPRAFVFPCFIPQTGIFRPSRSAHGEECEEEKRISQCVILSCIYTLCLSVTLSPLFSPAPYESFICAISYNRKKNEHSPTFIRAPL